MKKLLTIILLFITTCSYGQITLSQLTGATSLNTSDLFLLSQGASSRKLTYSLLRYNLFNTIPYALRLNYSSDSLRIGFSVDSTKFETNNHYFVFNKKTKAPLFMQGTDTLATKAYSRSLIIPNTWPQDSSRYASKSKVYKSIHDSIDNLKSLLRGENTWPTDSAKYISKSQARKDIHDSITSVKTLLRGENTWPSDSSNYANQFVKKRIGTSNASFITIDSTYINLQTITPKVVSNIISGVTNNVPYVTLSSYNQNTLYTGEVNVDTTGMQVTGNNPSIKLVLGSDTCKHFFSGDSAKWHTSKQFFAFDKPVYVNGKELGSAYTASTGITKVGNDFRLVAQTQFSGSTYTGLWATGSGNYITQIASGSSIQQKYYDITLSLNDKIKFAAVEDDVKSASAWFGINGFYYYQNYGARFTDRSLVDKNYVDSTVSVISSPTASNGLTKVTNDIQLGGTITDNISITNTANKYINLHTGTNGSDNVYSELYTGTDNPYFLNFDTPGKNEAQVSLNKWNVSISARSRDTLTTVKVDSAAIKYLADYSYRWHRTDSMRVIPDKAEIYRMINKTQNVYSGSLTDGTPTASEINAILGTAASATRNKIYIIKDTDGSGLAYHVLTLDGSAWSYFPGVSVTTAL